MPRFSVIIPLYNKENYIETTLRSVIAQRFSDFEVIVIDDCSTDKSLLKVKGITDKRIRILQHEKNKGLSASRNTGIRASSSDYLAFLDADDFWQPNYLETIHQLIDKYPIASLYASTYQLKMSNGATVVHDLSFLGFKDEGVLENFFKSNLNQNIYYPSCLTVHKNVFETIGYYNESIQFSEDVDFNIRAHAHYRMAFTTKPLVTYLVDSENQITQRPLGDKVIPDYDAFELQFPERADIKRYLDFQRYVKAKQYKMGKDSVRFRTLMDGIDMENINWKQRMLLRLPRAIVGIITRGKMILQNVGIVVSSYNKGA